MNKSKLTPQERTNYKEEWRYCIWPYTRYIVSNYGRVKSFGGKFLKQHKNRFGYMQVALSSKGKPRTFLVHRLVAYAFCEGYDEKNGVIYVDHLNGARTDNRAVNLEWVTRAENNRRSAELKPITQPILLMEDNKPVRMYASMKECDQIEGGRVRAHMVLGCKYHGCSVKRITNGFYKKMVDLVERQGYTLFKAYVELMTNLQLDYEQEPESVCVVPKPMECVEGTLF